jgi:hypothetical protein
MGEVTKVVVSKSTADLDFVVSRGSLLRLLLSYFFLQPR